MLALKQRPRWAEEAYLVMEMDAVAAGEVESVAVVVAVVVEDDLDDGFEDATGVESVVVVVVVVVVVAGDLGDGFVGVTVVESVAAVALVVVVVREVLASP